MGGDNLGRFNPRANYTCEQAVLTVLRIAENVVATLAK